MGDPNVPQGYLQALLAFATRVGSDDPVNQPSTENAAPMSQPDREWLMKALSEHVANTDPVEIMKKNIETLLTIDLFIPRSEKEEETGIRALESLLDLCLDIDLAADFHKVGGFRLFSPLLRSQFAEFRVLILDLIGTISQNHPYIQQELAKAQIMPLLLQVLEHDGDAAVKAKALFAISRSLEASNAPEHGHQFLAENGIRKILGMMDILQSKPQFIAKALFFFKRLAHQGPQYADAVLKNTDGMLEIVVGTFRNSNSEEQVNEFSLALLDEMCNVEKNVISLRRNDFPGLHQLMEERLTEMKKMKDSAFEESIQSISSVLRKWGADDTKNTLNR